MNPTKPDPLKFRLFQRQDFARGALHDGLILNLDTGLGKSIAAYTWSLLKLGWALVDGCLRPNGPVLLVVPGDLHDQMEREGCEKMHIQTQRLDSQAAFDRLIRPDNKLPRLTEDGRPIIPPGFYLTSYTQLTINGVQRIPDPMDCDKPRALLQQWCLKESAPNDTQRDPAESDLPRELLSVTHVFTWRDRIWRDEYDLLRVHRDDTMTELDAALKRELELCDGMEDQKAAANLRAKLEQAHRVLKNLFTYRRAPKYPDLTLTQQDFVIREFLRRRFEDYATGEGQFRRYDKLDVNRWGPPIDATEKFAPPAAPIARQVKCLYSPSLADLCYDAFDCVAVDEGVKMKGEDTYVGKGVRSLIPKYRLVLTATPIKNRLPDIFRLAWWATGGRSEAHARFPYKDSSSEREQFASTFLVSETNLTKEAEAQQKHMNARQIAKALRKGTWGEDKKDRPRNSRFTKLTAEICNVHRLWKLLGPIVLRRRKDECGEEIVPRIRKVVRCEMGTRQKQVYRYHLEASYLDRNGLPAPGAQLTSLRIAATDPTSSHLPFKGEVPVDCGCRSAKLLGAADQKRVREGKGARNCQNCQGSGKLSLPHRGANPYTPKFASVLSLVHEIIARNEQVLIGTVFNESHDHLGALLREADVPFILADGRTKPSARGPMMRRFKDGDAPVCLGGLESIANGHNLDTVNNVIVYSYSWAFDLIKQFLDRVHRLTSRKPINVYVVICNGTIDRRLESLNAEKTDSVELALDGRLVGERSEDVNLAELLAIAREEFNTEDKTVDEGAIQREWPALRGRLQAAMRAWSVDGKLRRTVQRIEPVRPWEEASFRPPIQVAADWRSQMRAVADQLRAAQSGDLWAAL